MTSDYPIIAILLFFAIVFIQSGYDKVTDWQGNLGWLKGHFSKTFIKNYVPQSLMMILVMEVLSGAFSVIGIIQMFVNGSRDWALTAGCFSAATLLFLILGQRMAKDYDGARTIAIYFIPAVLLLHWLG